MIWRLFLLIALLFSAIAAPAQAQTDKQKKSTELLGKARQIDLLNMVLPLVMTKSQINQMLPLLEKARAKEKVIESREADMMRSMETKINTALDKGINDGVVPSLELLKELNRMFIAFSMSREATITENVEAILEGLKRSLNSGQIKAAANSIDPKAFDPSADPAKMSQDDRLKFFIRANLLDPLCYDVLVKLSTSKAIG